MTTRNHKNSYQLELFVKSVYINIVSNEAHRYGGVRGRTSSLPIRYVARDMEYCFCRVGLKCDIHSLFLSRIGCTVEHVNMYPKETIKLSANQKPMAQTQ